MEMVEIFPNYDRIFRENSEAAIRNADQAMLANKRQKKQAEIMKARDSVVNKQKQLSDINNKSIGTK